MDIFNCEKYTGNKSFVYFYLPNSFRIPQNKSYLKQMSKCKMSENRDFLLFECPLPYISSSNRYCQVLVLFYILYILASKFLKQLHEAGTIVPISEMRKLKHRDGKSSAGKEKSQDLNPDSLALGSVLLTPTLLFPLHRVGAQ